MKRYILLALIATLLAFTGGSAVAQEDCEFTSEFDDSGDCMISEDEFYEYYETSGLFGEWDANDDGWIDSEEFGDGLYDYYDDNDDGLIDEGELEVTDDPDEEGFWDF